MLCEGFFKALEKHVVCACATVLMAVGPRFSTTQAQPLTPPSMAGPSASAPALTLESLVSRTHWVEDAMTAVEFAAFVDSLELSQAQASAASSRFQSFEEAVSAARLKTAAAAKPFQQLFVDAMNRRKGGDLSAESKIHESVLALRSLRRVSDSQASEWQRLMLADLNQHLTERQQHLLAHAERTWRRGRLLNKGMSQSAREMNQALHPDVLTLIQHASRDDLALRQLLDPRCTEIPEALRAERASCMEALDAYSLDMDAILERENDAAQRAKERVVDADQADRHASSHYARILCRGWKACYHTTMETVETLARHIDAALGVERGNQWRRAAAAAYYPALYSATRTECALSVLADSGYSNLQLGLAEQCRLLAGEHQSASDAIRRAIQQELLRALDGQAQPLHVAMMERGGAYGDCATLYDSLRALDLRDHLRLDSLVASAAQTSNASSAKGTP